MIELRIRTRYNEKNSLKVGSVEATMALLEKSSEGRVTAATAMNKVIKHDVALALYFLLPLWSSTFSTLF